MIVITVILALLIMGCKSDEMDTEISTDMISNLELPCSYHLSYLSYPQDLGGRNCHFPYRQGPCNPAEILVPANDKITGKCVKNLCEKDGLVEFKHQCYELNTEGPCKPVNEQSYKLAVNPFTFILQCLPTYIFTN